MNKRDLSETDIRSKFITPTILKAGWDRSLQIREELYFTKGRIIVRGKLVSRGKAKNADYVLYYKPNIPIAIIEAKDIRAGLIKINPVKGIKLLNPNNVRDRILSSEETARLFAAAGSSDDFVQPLFHMLFHTGMRLGEVLALEWADVEFEHRRIVIRQSKSGEGRKIPLRSALADELIRWKPLSRGSRWVFPARYDVAEPMQSIRKGWSRLCVKAAVSLLRPHDLRHNFTSQLQAAGISDSIIMSITGHKTHVMLHRYSHANDEHKRKALEALPDHQVGVSGDVVSIRRIKT